jgi:uncharacterized protein
MPARPRLFLGHVMHRRTRPAVNAFVYPVFYVQLPVNDLAAAQNRVFSVDRFNLLSLQRQGSRPARRQSAAAVDPAEAARARLPDDGEIVLQCFPRVLGYVFNPVSFWFCHDREGH